MVYIIFKFDKFYLYLFKYFQMRVFILFIILSFLSISLFFGTKVRNVIISNTDSSLYKYAEQAYFYGQKDAINGDVRIKYDSATSLYKWTKSPWNSGRKPVFIPTKSNNKDTITIKK